MSDHSRRHTKPTSEEVYQDAKRILEEYLKRKLSEHGEHGENNNKRYARSESYKAASRDNIVQDEKETVHVDKKGESLADEQYGVERSKTMPSSFKNEIINKEKGAKKLSKKSSKDKYSSPETDAEPSDDEDFPKRKKKSFFKKAKERLMHALNRDSRSGDEDVDINIDHKAKKKRKKPRGKTLGNGDHDSPDMNRHVKETHAHIDQHISVGGDHGSRGLNLLVPGEGSSSLQDSHSSLSRRDSAGKRFMDSIRKSFRKNKKKDISESKSAEPVSVEDRDRSYSRSNSTPDRSSHISGGDHPENTSLNIPSRSGSETPERHSKDRLQNSDSNPRRNSKSRADVVVTQTRDRSAPRTIQAHGLHVDSDAFSSVAPPPYIPPHFRGNIESSVDVERRELTLADDGLWERSVTTHSHERTKYLPQKSLEIDGKEEHSLEDEVDSPTSPEDKEETIDRIVKKLIEIGDNFQSEGEARQSQESEGAVGGSPRTGDDVLSSLEREIIECLRIGGDKATDKIDGAANEFINGAVRQSVYDRFSTTLRQSVGDEVNWNQMALVFHATKSALKVAGAGTTKATQIKDLTLKYLTEKCASWIVDQGGWESIVSDTDSELD